RGQPGNGGQPAHRRRPGVAERRGEGDQLAGGAVLLRDHVLRGGVVLGVHRAAAGDRLRPGGPPPTAAGRSPELSLLARTTSVRISLLFSVVPQGKCHLFATAILSPHQGTEILLLRWDTDPSPPLGTVSGSQEIFFCRTSPQPLGWPPPTLSGRGAVGRKPWRRCDTSGRSSI